MEKDSMVSIIIPTFGRPLLLKRAIESCLNQTFDNLEIIVVDDNGVGKENQLETEIIISEFIESGKVRYFPLKENRGGATARNYGAEMSNGEYLCFLDDDDEFYPSKIKKQVEKFNTSFHKPSIVGCYADITTESGRLIRLEKTDIKGDVYNNQLMNNICTTSIAMVNSKYFKKAGGFDDVSSSQEHRLFIKILSINPYYDYVPESLVRIYHHSGERISTGSRKADGAIELYKFVKSLIQDLSIDQQQQIHVAHHKNIIRSYMVNTHNKKHALKYFFDWIQLEKKVSFEMLKYLLIIILGVSRANKFRTILK